MTTLNTLPIYDSSYIWNELKAMGKEDGPLVWEDLEVMDQLHYFGASAIEHAATFLGIHHKSHVLDIGSGLGGPARFLASRYGCRVTGIELQADLYENCKILTKRCELHPKVQFIQGDFTQLELPSSCYDFLISFLVFLHIQDKSALLLRCAHVLRQDAGFYIEDYFARKPLTNEDKSDLRTKVGCSALLSQNEYLAAFHEAGFRDVKFEEVTELWTSFLLKRWTDFQTKCDQKIRIHGKAFSDKLEEFYQTTYRLFENGNVGGARIYGKL